MRFLGVGDSCDLGALYLKLLAEGHSVKVSIANPMCHGTLAGLVDRSVDWVADLDWIRSAGEDGIILFENVSGSRGLLQDKLRAEGFHVVGGSAFGDRLENDRAFAQQVLAESGLLIARTWAFTCEADADRFISENPGRYVLKFDGPGFASNDNYVGQLEDGRDTRAVLATKLRGRTEEPISFVLMEYVSGIEMGVGAYFNGKKFLAPACLDWEHKRLFAGDLGELTGEMGTVVTYDRSQRFFERTLLRMEPRLREAGHCGYVNLNTIVNEAGIWPLEFTCRFGYPGFAILDPLQVTPWADIFRAMVHGTALQIETCPGFAVGVVLTTPPFPYTRKQIAEPVGLPVLIDESLSHEDRNHLHFGEVGLDEGQLVTSGIFGWTMVATGVGAAIADAKCNAYRVAAGVFAPNLRYRRDIGDKLIERDWTVLGRLDLLDDLL